MADRTSSAVTIDASADAVLGVIADLHAYPEWNGEIKAVEVLDTFADGRARQARFSISSSGMTDQYTLDYTWAPDGVSWTLVAPSQMQKKQQGSYRLAEQDGRTEVTYDLAIESRIPMIGPMRRKIEKRIVDGALTQLQRRVETLR